MEESLQNRSTKNSTGRNCNAYNECMQAGRRNACEWKQAGKSYSQGLITQAEWQACNAARSYDSALIPLIGNNSWFYIIPLLMLIFIKCIWWLCFTFRPAFSASYIIIQIYLFIYTIYNPNGLYSNSIQGYYKVKYLSLIVWNYDSILNSCCKDQ